MRTVPTYTTKEFFEKRNKYALCIPILNEGERIKKQLIRFTKQNISHMVDIIILDGGSTDNALSSSFLQNNNIRAMLVKTGSGGLSAQLRMGFDYCLNNNYDGVITVDGNNKDGALGVAKILEALKNGYDFIQGSRFIKGGKAINTPPLRYLAIRLMHAPIISFKASFKYTDTTNGFRGHSAALLRSSRLNIFRNCFNTYELLPFISVNAPRLGFRTIEVPVLRRYPKNEKTPTKISFLKGNIRLLKTLFTVEHI